MRSRWLQSIVFALAIVIAGGHVVALQVIAWSGMVISRTQDQGLVVALRTTFDGEHPCPMCRAVKTMQAADETGRAAVGDQDREPAAPLSKLVKKAEAILRGITVQAELAGPDPGQPWLVPAGLRAQFVSTPEPPPPRLS